MPIYEFMCENGHRTTLVLHISEFKEETPCVRCRIAQQEGVLKRTRLPVQAKLVPSRTGTPILKRGIGGFERPYRD